MDGCQPQPGLVEALGLTSLPLSSSRVPAVSQSSLLFKPWAAGLTLWTLPSSPGLSQVPQGSLRPTVRMEGSQVEGNCSSQSGQVSAGRLWDSRQLKGQEWSLVLVSFLVTSQKSPHIPTCSPGQSKSPLVSLMDIGLALTVCVYVMVQFPLYLPQE